MRYYLNPPNLLFASIHNCELTEPKINLEGQDHEVHVFPQSVIEMQTSEIYITGKKNKTAFTQFQMFRVGD